MVLFSVGLLLTLGLFVGLGFVRGTRVTWKLNAKQLLSVLGVAVIALSCYVSVPTGHTGVVTTFGSVEDYTLEAGMHFKLPWQEVIKMDNRVQKNTQDLSCFSSDIQEVSMTYTVNYQISKLDAMTIYKDHRHRLFRYRDRPVHYRVRQDRHCQIQRRGARFQPQPDGGGD